MHVNDPICKCLHEQCSTCSSPAGIGTLMTHSALVLLEMSHNEMYWAAPGSLGFDIVTSFEPSWLISMQRTPCPWGWAAVKIGCALDVHQATSIDSLPPSAVTTIERSEQLHIAVMGETWPCKVIWARVLTSCT
jgi:hypothetical protein